MVLVRSRAGQSAGPVLNSLTVNQFRRNFPARMNRGWEAVDHRVGVLDAHSVGASMLLHDLHYSVIGFRLSLAH